MIKATYVDHMGSDLSVVNAARVSFAKHREALGSVAVGDYTVRLVLHDSDTKLIKYLAKHKHTSPFGHAFASFHVKAPVFVARQLVKHKFLRWNEISRRYVDDEPEFYSPNWREATSDKKQGSGDEVTKVMQFSAAIKVNNQNTLQAELYKEMLAGGICEEQARIVLPQSMMTEWYWSGSLDAFADMCRLRCASDTQAETQKVAWDISLKMEDLFPASWVALRDE
tara:strand:+ start:309 stop:983 length:675 start_codon:yes stop_codon:yes gene_type:complete